MANKTIELTEREQEIIAEIEQAGEKLNNAMRDASAIGLQVNVNPTNSYGGRQVHISIVKPVGGVNAHSTKDADFRKNA